MDNCSGTKKTGNQSFPPLMQTAPIAIYEIENPFSPKLRRVNDATADLLGYSREELLSANPFDFLTPESKVKFKQRIGQAQAGNKLDQNVEYQVLTKGGKLKSVMLSIQPTLKDDKVFGALVIAYDITELKKAEEELAETKDRLQNILDTMNDGLISISLDGKIIGCNETTLKQLGLTKEEVIGKNITDLILPEDRAHMMAEVQPEVRATGKGLTQVRVVRKDGSFFFAEISVTAIYDKNRKPTGMFGVARDITDRKKAEEALKTSEERLHNIINAMDDGIVLIGLDGRVIDYNQATLKQFNMKQEEILGKVIMDYMYSENKENFIKETQDVLRKTGKAIVETQLVRKNESPLPVEVSLTRFYDKDKKPIGLLGVARDIAERKQVQETLRETEEKFRGLVETTSDWIWQVDQNAVYTYASPKIKDILGYSPDEVLGRTPFESMPQEEAEKIAKEFEKIAKQKMPFHGLENWNCHKNGNRVLLETSGVPILDTAGELIGYRGIDRDITERKKAEAALKESEALYRTLFDNSEDGFMLLEAIFDKKGKACDIRFLKFNSAYERQTGARAQDVLGKLASEVTPELEPEIILLSGKVSKTGKPIHDEAFNKYSNKWYDSYYFRYSEGKVGILFRDITDRKNFEEALSQSERKYRDLTETTSDFIWEIDASGKYTYCSPRIETIFGFKPEEMIGKSPFDMIPDSEKAVGLATFGKVIASKKPFYGLQTIANSSKGKLINVETSGIPFFDSQGRLQGYRGISRDITERKKAEEELKKNEEQLRVQESRLSLVYNNVTESLFSLGVEPNGHFRFTSVNKTFLETTGLHESQVVGRSVDEVITEPSLTMVLGKYKQAIEEKKPVRWEEVTAYPSGEKHGEVTIAPLFDSNGRCVSLIGNVHDITQRRKAEKALKVSEERYRQLFSSMTEMFFVADLQYDKTGKVVDYIYRETNPAFVGSIGRTTEQVVGKRAKELFAGIGIEKVWLDELNKVNKTGKPYYGEQFSKRTGRFYEVHVWKISDNLTGVVSHDITQRKSLEKQLRDNERLAAIGQTAGMVGHDIRNPLQAIVGELYVARSSIDEASDRPDKEEALESVNFIQAQVDYINKIVSDLQDFARPIVPEYSIVDLSDVIVHTFETVSVPESINLSVNVRDAENIRVDSALLQRVVTNLVNNAIQAMPEGGKLEVCGEKKDSAVTITVSDTGVGIPDDVKLKLFTPMMTTKAKGQGFGLAVSKRMIEAMKGTISFESEKGKGTKFIIELPTTNS